jgi:hypothetical protein
MDENQQSTWLVMVAGIIEQLVSFVECTALRVIELK